ncbi:glycosyl transferase (plasmid) [Mycobacterium sp. JS623]|uniref:glycosyltransferase n=1 Tax=Mycobacterium sp. JS623 TaxID=212767 RepID=UPI0002A55679|nr:glycosyltransferase [Mycobacterium sp. JS623]AGB26688.1 glycosyl transferase [Mycobacterium sp. JS623]
MSRPQRAWPRVSGRAPLIGHLDAAGDRYLRRCVAVLQQALGEDLLGAYLYSSAVLGDYVPGRSDLDMVAVVRAGLPQPARMALAEQILGVPRPFPTRGLDLEVITADSAACGSVRPPIELKVFSFAEYVHTAADEPHGDPRLVMHFACCRDHGVALVGPPPAEVFAPVSHDVYVAELGRELDAHWMTPHYLVLNACRDWRYIEETVICSKVAGGQWARSRLADPWLVDAALCWQTRGVGPVMDPVLVEGFLGSIAQRLRGPDGQRPTAEVNQQLPSAWRAVASVGDAIEALQRRPAMHRHVEAPLVSCIHVCSHDLDATDTAVRAFCDQEYAKRELVVVTPEHLSAATAHRLPRDVRIRAVTQPADLDPGAARDLGCAHAAGDLIALWEGATWYAPWRLRYQVSELLRSGHTVSAATSTIVWDPAHDESWIGRTDTDTKRRLIVGATLCQTRSECTAYSFAARYANAPRYRNSNAPFTFGAPERPFHVPRDAHFAVVVAPWSFQKAPSHARYPKGVVSTLLGGRAPEFAAAAGEVGSSAPEPAPPLTPPAPHQPRFTTANVAPLVTCIMPTFNRRRFVAQAVRNIARQDYPAIELVVVDDGSEPVADLLAPLPHTKYLRLDRRHTIGHKRNLACEAASGKIIIQWDDDDWYGPQRVSRQVSEIVDGNADATGIGVNLLLDVRSMQIWSTRERQASDPLFGPVESLAGGTIAMRKDIWRQVNGYPDASNGEDVGFLQRVAEAGGSILAISNQGAYVYVRHGRNSWRFDFSPDEGPPTWRRNDPPPGMDDVDLNFYTSLSNGAAVRQPLATSDLP